MPKELTVFRETIRRRLREVELFWSEALENYQSIDIFIPKLNASLQALRNVTFILQSHKSLIPDFDRWYVEKQEEMRNDEKLRWCVEARNQITKQGDLELRSNAIVRVMNWLKKDLISIEFPGIISDEDLASMTFGEVMGKRIELLSSMREPLLEIERNWKANSGPDQEILSLVSYGFRKLSALVNEALTLAGTDGLGELTEMNGEIFCESTPKECRSTLIDLKDLSVLGFTETPFDFSIETGKQAKKRYGRPKMEEHAFGGKNPFDDLTVVLSQSKIIFEKDGFHAPMVFYYGTKGLLHQYVIPASDKTQQYAMMEKIASDIPKFNLTGLLFIKEAWIYQQGEKKRGEALIVTAVDNDRRLESHTRLIDRGILRSKLGESSIITEIKNQNWLRPVLKAWGMDI